MDKRELLLDLLARDRTGPATKKAAENLEDVAEAAEDASKATETLGDKADETAESVEDLGEKAEETARASETLGDQTQEAGEKTESFGAQAKTAAEQVAQLDEEIRNTERELHTLAASFADAGDAAERLDIAKAIRRTEAEIRRLNKSKGILSALIPQDVPPAETRSLASKIVGSLGSALGSAASGIGDQLGPKIGIAAGVAAAPILLGTLAGAISAGAGTIGIGAGIALAVKNDPELKGLGKAIGDRLFGELEDAASKSLGGPIRESLHTLAGYGDEIVDDWGAAFEKLAPYVEPFIDDIGRGVASLSESLAEIAGESGPVLDALGDGFVKLADAIGTSLKTITEDTEGSAEALDVAFGFIAEETKSLAGAFAGAGQAIKEELEIWGVWDDLVERYGTNTVKAKIVIRGQADAHKEAADAANGQRAALEGLSNQLKADVDPVFGLLNAQDQLAQAQRDVTAATKEHGKGSDEAKAALRRLAEAALELEGKAGQLGGTFDGKLSPAMRATLQAAGLTKGQIRQLEAQFREAKKDGDRFAKKYEARAAVEGVPGVRSALRGLNREANKIDGRVIDIAVRITGNSNTSAVKHALEKQYREFGGPVKKGHAYVVGEKRPEVFVPDRDGKIIPSVEKYRRQSGETEAAAWRELLRRVPGRGGRSGIWDLPDDPVRRSPATPTPGVIVHELVIRFDFGPSELGQVLAKAVRTQPALAATLAKHLRVRFGS